MSALVLGDVLTINNVHRFNMSQEQRVLTLWDLDDLTKRNRDLYKCFTTVDIEWSRITEDLITANSRMDQLHNEHTNVRAERKIWEVRIS